VETPPEGRHAALTKMARMNALSELELSPTDQAAASLLRAQRLMYRES
jgi:hypothetical protein